MGVFYGKKAVVTEQDDMQSEVETTYHEGKEQFKFYRETRSVPVGSNFSREISELFFNALKDKENSKNFGFIIDASEFNRMNRKIPRVKITTFMPLETEE